MNESGQVEGFLNGAASSATSCERRGGAFWFAIHKPDGLWCTVAEESKVYF